MGEVAKPGEYPYRPGMTVLTAVSTAGGYTFRADQDSTTVTRQIEGRSITGRASESAPIQPGDTIRIRESWFQGDRRHAKANGEGSPLFLASDGRPWWGNIRGACICAEHCQETPCTGSCPPPGTGK